VLAVNAAEARHLREAGCADVRMLGHRLLPAPDPAGFAARGGLLFVGNLARLDEPNADSLRWFVREVMPALDALAGTACVLDVAGECHPALHAEIGGPRVRLHGRVEDLSPLYAQVRVFIAPTRFAAGIAHKVHEAAAHGVPVVATPLIARQLEFADGAELLCGDTPQAFARACARLLGEPELWQRLREAALARVARDCDPARFDAVVRGLLT